MDLVMPVIPNAQENKGAEIFAQSLGTGLAAMARFADMKRQSEMDVLKLAEHERVSQEQNILEREKMALDHDIRQQTLAVHRTVQSAQADYYKARAKAYADGTATAAQRAIAHNQQREALVNEVNQHAEELKLTDPAFQTKQPIQFAANVMQFEDAWRQSTLPEVKHAVRTFRTLADQQKIPLKVGATIKEDSDPDNPIWVGGTVKMVPLWQIVEKMRNPEEQEETANALQASGHVNILDTFTEIAGMKVPTKTRELTPQLKSVMEQGKNVRFEHVPSRVPAAMLPKGAAGGTTPTQLPEPDLPPDTSTDEPQASIQFDDTGTDRILKQAKAAIAQGAPAAAVAKRLQSLGIDAGAILDAAA